MKEKIVYVQEIAAKLLEMGFELIEVRPNPQKPHLDCFVFERTPELQLELTKLILKRRNQNAERKFTTSSDAESGRR